MKNRAKPKPSPASAPPGVDALLDCKGVLASLRISERVLYDLMASGGFPRPEVTIGRLKRWRTSTVNKWIEGRADGSGATT